MGSKPEIATLPHHACDQEHRLVALERARDDHSGRLRDAEKSLGDGRVEFAELRKDLQAATRAIEALTERVGKAMEEKKNAVWEKVLDAVIHWGVPAIIVALLWVFAKSGQIPGVPPQTYQAPPAGAHP